MQSLKIIPCISNYTKIQYSKTNYLNNILKKNNEVMIKYTDNGGGLLENQNILVEFLKQFTLSIAQSDEYLYNEIIYKANGIASRCNITSIYNRGKTQFNCIFPESNHYTLFVIPFGKSRYPLAYYQNTKIEDLNAYTTLYTTDMRMRYNTSKMTENIGIIRPQPDYSVIAIDPLALCFGYIRYCRERIASGRNLGLSPNSYLAGLPLANFYSRHNQYTIVNMMRSLSVSIDHTKWSKIDATNEIVDYLSFQRTTMRNMRFKEFNHYAQQLVQGEAISGNLYDTLFPYDGSSRSYNQLSWVYSLGGMDWSIKYLQQCLVQGWNDTAFKAFLQPYLRNSVTIFTNQIQDRVWQTQFTKLFEELTLLAGGI